MSNTNAKQILLGITLAVVIFVVLISVRSIAFGDYQANTKTNTKTQTSSVKNTNIGSGEVQYVKLSMRNYEYILEPSVLIKDIPVVMEVDMNTVYGCMRNIVIPSFGVREYVNEQDNVFEFTPDKTGEFGIACSMNMGRGKFTVIEQDGTKSDFVETPASDDSFPIGSCGSAPGETGVGGCALAKETGGCNAGGAGGCGCGGY